MLLRALPLVFVLCGLALYVVLAGADFGAGLWQLLAGRGERAERIRDHALHALGPVWEANHVWLIFALTVTWTAYPLAFGSIASTLVVPLFLAALGIILRGAMYALLSADPGPRQRQAIGLTFSASSILTPFALGAAIGAVASGRVPVGNAAGPLFSSWLTPTSALIGGLAVATGAYLAAVYLAADSARLGEADLERWFRTRALVAGVLTGALAVAGLVVVHGDAHRLYAGLTGDGLPAIAVSVVAGLATLGLVWRRRYELARGSAALAVAALVAGWALAQEPTLLPGLTVTQAAAPRNTLVALIVAVIAGGVILFPTLALLFRLYLGGRFDEPAAYLASPDEPADVAGAGVLPERGLVTRLAVACLIVGFGLLTVANAGWAHAVGATALLASVAFGFRAVLPALL